MQKLEHDSRVFVGNGYPKGAGVDLVDHIGKPWEYLPLEHELVSSPVNFFFRRGPSHQSHTLERTDTYGQAQVCSGGQQGSSFLRQFQIDF